MMNQIVDKPRARVCWQSGRLHPPPPPQNLNWSWNRGRGSKVGRGCSKSDKEHIKLEKNVLLYHTRGLGAPRGPDF